MVSWSDLQDNWAVVAGFAVGAVAWGKTVVTSSSARASASKAHERINETDKAVSEIKQSTARTETHCEHIMKTLAEMKQEMRDSRQ